MDATEYNTTATNAVKASPPAVTPVTTKTATASVAAKRVAKPRAPAVKATVIAPVKTSVTQAPAKTPVTKSAVKAAVNAAVKATAKVKVKAVAKPKAAKPAKVKKPKLVRDSFTIPKAEYTVLEDLKQRAGKLASSVKKSEFIRAGIKALAAMTDSAFLAAVKAVPAIKTGRPTNAKAE